MDSVSIHNVVSIRENDIHLSKVDKECKTIIVTNKDGAETEICLFSEGTLRIKK